MSTSYLVQPPTLRPWPGQIVVSGDEVSPGSAAQVDTSAGPATIDAPGGALTGVVGFAVVDTAGMAASNPITVDGNGRLIDGAATAVLNADGVEAVFMLDGAEWRRVAPPRVYDDDVGGGPMIRLDDLPSGGSSPSSCCDGVCTLEDYGAVGDGVTNDQAAWALAIAALNSGACHTLQLGAGKTYLVEGGVNLTASGRTIQGSGWGSVLKTVTNQAVIQLISAHNTTLRNFLVQGSNGGNTLQRAVASGFAGADGSSKLLIEGVKAVDMGGIGFLTQYAPAIIGAILIGCVAENCDVAGFAHLHEATHSSCQAFDCAIGLAAWAGNVVWSGGDIIGCAIGTEVTVGGNDGHGILSGANCNHCTTAVRVEAIVNGHTFDGCHFYDGAISIAACTGYVTFNGCKLDVSTYANAGLVRFKGAEFAANYFVSWTETGNGSTEFVACRGIDGSTPAFLANRLQPIVPFPSDAPMTLSAQDSTCDVLTIATGAATSGHQVTAYWPAEDVRRFIVLNQTPYEIQFRWSTGSPATLPPESKTLVGSDGSDAELLLDAGAFPIPGATDEVIRRTSGGMPAVATNVRAGANYIGWGPGTLSTVGYGRFPEVTSTVLLGGKATPASNDQIIGIGAVAYRLYFGEVTPLNWTVQIAGDPMYVWGRSTVQVLVGAGGAEAWRVTATEIKHALPVGGSSENAQAFRLKSATIARSTLADYTLTAGEAECPFLIFNGTAGSGTLNVIAPNQPGAIYFIDNPNLSTYIQFGAAAGTGVLIQTSERAIVIHDGSDYVAFPVP